MFALWKQHQKVKSLFIKQRMVKRQSVCRLENDTVWRLTGEKVEFATDIMSTTVTYWRPKVGSSVKRIGSSEGTTPKTTPSTTPKLKKEKGPELRQKMIRIMKATPTISKAELADLLRITVDGVTYHVRILRKERGVHWEGSSIKGHWVIPE